MSNHPLGISGRVAAAFQSNALTPLLAIAGLLLGVFAVLITPREEEPQIDVTFANVFVPFAGASSQQVESLVATPMEQLLSEIDGVEHIYSVSKPGQAIFTVQFEVGQPRQGALVRLYNAIYSNRDWRPSNSGIGEAVVKPMGIDDVPVLAATLWSESESLGSTDLLAVARGLQVEIQRVDGARNVTIAGGADEVVRVVLEPELLAGYNLAIDDIRNAISQSNVVAHVGSRVAQNHTIPVQAGQFLASPEEVEALVVGMVGGRPIYLGDIATIEQQADQAESYSWYATGPAALEQVGFAPAVTIAVSKKPGTNASAFTQDLIERIEQLKSTYVPEGIVVQITRNYGQTANDKAQTLIKKLLFATASVVLLVFFTLGWREALIVGVAVVVTLAMTLFASWVWGFTINRVSLFALIFAIGILVDDAIVVVENIHRHRLLHTGSLGELIPAAVDEVGGPTILATLTVIAALLPMAFVSGLMGPYMSPIPINASTGMLISLAIALILTPWMCRRFLSDQASTHQHPQTGRLHRLFDVVLRPFVDSERGQRRRAWLYLGLVAAIGLSAATVPLQWVVLKMLPFDNKSEFQLVLDMPEGTPVEQTAAVLDRMASVLTEVPEVENYQVYAGSPAPISFNGLVRQYYLRSGPTVGDIQIQLLDKKDRERSSHAIAREVRQRLAGLGSLGGARIKVVEVPPGPPVMAPLVAEVYGPQYEGQRQLAKALQARFDQTEDIVDVDSSVEADTQREVIAVDRDRAALFGISQQSIISALKVVFGGDDVSYVRQGEERSPIPVRLQTANADKADQSRAMSYQVRGQLGQLVALSELTSTSNEPWDGAIYHKDLLPVVFVTADMAGSLDSPLYGMFELSDQIEAMQAIDRPVEQFFRDQPANPFQYSVKWDGEWQITYETFRDMGLAYAVGLLLIYLLVVAQFKSYLTPLVIMAPIPLTMIGVMPGHALLGAQFTATSMIGMIALAGIIVRNSILLVDFIEAQRQSGQRLEEAVIRAAEARAMPIALTALAATLGAFFILDDPIFNGLAVSLIFGIGVSTLLTIVVIPVLYFSIENGKKARVGQLPSEKPATGPA
ncbi:MAG: multidrug transporter AcrB [Lysobacteraceae bacterium]|nr:MAG: multidrug transporter AcrB [Xanthomonadaceae bacterium]